MPALMWTIHSFDEELKIHDHQEKISPFRMQTPRGRPVSPGPAQPPSVSAPPLSAYAAAFNTKAPPSVLLNAVAAAAAGTPDSDAAVAAAARVQRSLTKSAKHKPLRELSRSMRAASIGVSLSPAQLMPSSVSKSSPDTVSASRFSFEQPQAPTATANEQGDATHAGAASLSPLASPKRSPPLLPSSPLNRLPRLSPLRGSAVAGAAPPAMPLVALSAEQLAVLEALGNGLAASLAQLPDGAYSSAPCD